MPHNKILLEKLSEISRILKEKFTEEKHLGVLGGVSGIALFQFYYAKFLDEDGPADTGLQIITHCIECINNGYAFPTYCTGLAGVGWVLEHLQQEDFMDVETDDLLPDLDAYLHNHMSNDIKNGNYDFLHGAIGYGFYFLKRYRNTKSEKLKERYRSYLQELIAFLDTTSKIDGTLVKWESQLRMETEERGYNLSLSHGIASIVSFLSRLYRYDDFKESTYAMLRGSTNYILSYMKEGDNTASSLFPGWVKEGEEPVWRSRVAWCYGDLGIGLSLWQASKSLEDPAMGKTAIKTLKHAVKRTSFENSMVSDAGVCHGSYGNAQIFNRMYQETKEEEFKEAAAFWIHDGLEKATHKDGYAGYKQWLGDKQEWQAELCLLEGIAGIGLAIISYLSEDETNWDASLMIS